LSHAQVWTLVYLGVVPSGICFFLWNVGARRTNAGTLAAFNNAKIPLAVLVSLLVFGEQARIAQLAIGGILILVAVVVNERHGRQTANRRGGTDTSVACKGPA
jgi:drug/metabolite transporter (DMT)-like permease